MKSWITMTLGWALVLPLQAFAQPVIPSDLPPAELARAAIEQEPSVVKARHALEAAGHAGRRIAASPYEWSVGIDSQRRRYDTGGNSNEWTARIERPIRIGGKAELDQGLGDTTERIARAELAQTRHEAARTLADLWIDWLAAIQARELAKEQLDFAESSASAVAGRRRAGDASLLDLNAAQADAAEARRQFDTTQAQETKAILRLRSRFPSLVMEPQSLSEPVELDLDEAQWRERVLAGSDTLRTMQESLKRAELTADRARADRIPDPTVGLFTASEARRSERIVGISVSIPLGGTYRKETMLEALKQADVARAELERQRKEIDLATAETINDARTALRRWRLAEQSAQMARENARLGQRGYSLGEGDLQSLLLLRRQSVDAAGASLSSRVEALKARNRLLIDAHLILGLADE
ncbi:TolC family protein [Pseudomonas aeruginosa]|uniref:Outer membrane protein TolC n=1 Tax=Pigmentiphaga daeguensis TaxID=414049 RepID=A0ABN1CYN5_9BURK|nr:MULTISPECIES: TolC family protein [Stenotrophomonas]MCO4013978.1 TolC family protein [Pseudomonas aeruginosa]QOG00035.1 TolC family protein [Stenotrophomonas sp. CW117]